MTELWKELHTRAISHEGTDDIPYLLEFSKKIPRFTSGCKCREFWTEWIKLNPPNFKNYFEWTVKAHNAVNTKLNKPTVSVDNARKMYK